MKSASPQRISPSVVVRLSGGMKKAYCAERLSREQMVLWRLGNRIRIEMLDESDICVRGIFDAYVVFIK